MSIDGFYEEVHRSYYPESDKAIASVAQDRLNKCRLVLRDMSFRSILNVGFESIAAANYLVSGRHIDRYCLVDIDKTVVERAIGDGFESFVTNVDVDPLPFDDEAFDVLYAGELIEHLFSPDHFLSEAHRVLKTSSKMVLTTPNIASWYNRLLLLCGLEPVNCESSCKFILGRKFDFLGEYGRPVGHIRVFNREALSKILELNGFHMEALIGYSRSDIPLDRLFSRFVSLASGFICVARKD